MNFAVRLFNCCFRPGLQFVDAAADFTLRRARRGFQPDIIDLSKNTVLAREPAIAKDLPVCLALKRSSFRVESGEHLSDRAVQCLRRVIFEFGDGVHDLFAKLSSRPTASAGAEGSAVQMPKVCAASDGARVSKLRLPSAKALGYHLPSRCARLSRRRANLIDCCRETSSRTQPSTTFEKPE